MRRSLAQTFEVIIDGTMQLVLDASIAGLVLFTRSGRDIASQLRYVSTGSSDVRFDLNQLVKIRKARKASRW